MALKDWKKVVFDDGTIYYSEKKYNGKKIKIEKDDSGKEGYILEIDGEYNFTKSKEQAIKKASKYMRTH
jgi:hypothetical protein